MLARKINHENPGVPQDGVAPQRSKHGTEGHPARRANVWKQHNGDLAVFLSGSSHKQRPSGLCSHDFRANNVGFNYLCLRFRNRTLSV